MICRSFAAKRALHFTGGRLLSQIKADTKSVKELQQPQPISYKPLADGVVLGETTTYNFAVTPKDQKIVTKCKDLFIHHAWTPASLMLHDHLHLFSLKTPLMNRRQNYTAFERLLEKKYEDAYKKCTSPAQVFHMSRRVQQQIRQFEQRVGIIDLDATEKIQHYPVWHPFREFLSSNTLKNYETKGVEIALLKASIYPIGKVWLPTRQNYLQLFDKYLSNNSLSLSDSPMLDVGCGSGILSFLIAKKVPKSCQLYGIDINQQAVTTANINAARLKIDNFKAIEMSITSKTDYSMFATREKLPLQYNLIISNPPWLAAKKLSADIGLDDGVYDDKQQFLQGLLAFTKKHLRKQGRLILFYSTLSQQLGLTKSSIEQIVQSHGLRVKQKLEVGYIDKLQGKDPLALYKQRSKIQLFEVRHIGR